MQLIVEPETTLDIDMSSVENIENNKNADIKIMSLDTDDHNDKKCNGNKHVSNIEKDAKSEETNSLSIDNNELSNVDLEEIINKNHGSFDKIESQNESSVNDMNGIDVVEKESMNINDTKDILEEDYLEDDIISIQEPFYEIAPPEIESGNVALEKSDNNVVESANTVQTELRKFEVEDTKTETENPSDQDDAIEAIEKIDHEQCLKDAEFRTPNKDNEIQTTDSHDKIAEDDIQTIESHKIPIKNDQQINKTIQQDENALAATEDPDHSSVKSGMTVESVLNDNDKIECIEESDTYSVRQEEKAEIIHNIIDDDKQKNTVELAPSTACENSVKSIQDSKLDDVEIVENIEKSSLEREHVIETQNTVNDTDSISVVGKTNVNSTQLRDKIDLENDSESLQINTNTPDSSSNNSSKGGIIEALQEPSVQDNKPNTPTEEKEADNSNKINENMADTISENLNSDSVVENSNTVTSNSPNKLNDDMDVEETVTEPKVKTTTTDLPTDLKDEMAVDEVLEETKCIDKNNTEIPVHVNTAAVKIQHNPVICKLSNTLDILSDDDEDELPNVDLNKGKSSENKTFKTELSKPLLGDDKQCIDIEDDDDIMVIDVETNKSETKENVDSNLKKEPVVNSDLNAELKTVDKTKTETCDLNEQQDIKEPTPPPVDLKKNLDMEIDIKEKSPEPKVDKPLTPPPLVPENFVKTAKKKLTDMTREELEEFCILKIVESIIDRSSLNDIKNKLKTITRGLEEYRKKALMLAKQNRDLQVVLKSVQEEQKKAAGGVPITPLKITRSVGMQIHMEKSVLRKKPQQQNNNKNANNAQNKNMPLGQGSRQQKQTSQSIPVPRLIPANNPALKIPSTPTQTNTPVKNVTSPNGIIKTPSLGMKPEKRQHSKIASSSVTVDLTDDEPPSKTMAGGLRTSPAPPVRLVPPQNLMGPQRQPFGTNVNSPRKVYIPISGPQNQSLRPGQAIMLKSVPTSGIRPRCPTPQVTRVDPNAVRMNRITPRHPAPLPFAMKQYQPPNWKCLPPAPDLKLSKVDNGIVISWKIEGVPEQNYEEIASYQLYAYQETSQPPSTTLWKKIGDVKALPLPMACTLTQFIAGFKYYFAVRAVDVKSRLGPFSLPGSILLLNKNI